MRIAVAIASKGRPNVLEGAISSLGSQTRPADVVWLGVTSPDDLPGTIDAPRVRVVQCAPGLTRQRNALLDAIGSSADLVAFLDDDAELHPTYLERAAAFAAARPDIVLFSGRVVADGAREGEISRDRASRLLAGRSPEERVTDGRTAYGCNMVMRTELARQVRFDETLPLYGWLEDLDFSKRMARRGGLACYAGCEMVHLGVGGGRQSGVRLGFQQVVHPIYLWREKHVLRLGEVVYLVGRPLIGNLLLGWLPRKRRPDRLGRLWGNALGFMDVLSRRTGPQGAGRLP